MAALTSHLGLALRPLHDTEPCGDQLGCWRTAHGLRLALADGLGHGHDAHLAAATALRQLAAHLNTTLETAFADCDARLFHTRGAALAVVDICPATASIHHAAVGNVRTLLIHNEKVTRLGGARGIVGAGFHGLRSECLTIHAGDWLVLFSDGIRENVDVVTALVEQQPSDQLAAQLLHRWADERDDASLLLYRHSSMPNC